MQWFSAERLRQCSRSKCASPGIAPRQPYAEVSSAKVVWCATCVHAIFGDEPPADLRSTVTVPQQSLPMDLHRGQDFVTPAQLARSTQYQRYLERTRAKETK